jgi:hypothetical protein
MRMTGWPGFFLWALVGGLYALACLAMMSIGVFILVIAIVTTIVATRTLRVWPEIIGLALGAPAFLSWVAFRALGLPQCGPGERPGISMVAGSGNVRLGTYTETVQLGCTELNAQSLVWTAAAISIAAVVAYIAARHRKLTIARSS